MAWWKMHVWRDLCAQSAKDYFYQILVCFHCRFYKAPLNILKFCPEIQGILRGCYARHAVQSMTSTWYWRKWRNVMPYFNKLQVLLLQEVSTLCTGKFQQNIWTMHANFMLWPLPYWMVLSINVTKFMLVEKVMRRHETCKKLMKILFFYPSCASSILFVDLHYILDFLEARYALEQLDQRQAQVVKTDSLYRIRTFDNLIKVRPYNLLHLHILLYSILQLNAFFRSACLWRTGHLHFSIVANPFRPTEVWCRLDFEKFPHQFWSPWSAVFLYQYMFNFDFAM